MTEIEIIDRTPLDEAAADLYKRTRQYLESCDSPAEHVGVEGIIDDTLADHGLVEVGRGRARVVVHLPDDIDYRTVGEPNNAHGTDFPEEWCVKLPTYGLEEYADGFHQSRRELLLWNSASGRQRMFLVPTADAAADFAWTAVPHAPQPDGGPWVDGLIGNMADVGIKGFEVRLENFGRLGGQVHLADYGHGVRIE